MTRPEKFNNFSIADLYPPAPFSSGERGEDSAIF